MHCSGGAAVEESRAVERSQEKNEDKLSVSDGQMCTQPPQEPCDRVLHQR